MDCPICNRAMMDQLTPDETGTCGWTCFEHGFFPVLCTCGYIEGQQHDILCDKKTTKAA